MAYFKLPVIGWVSHWHGFFTIILAVLLYSLGFGSSDLQNFIFALLFGFILSIPTFTFFKRIFFRNVIAFDMGGVFMSGNYRFERLKTTPEMVDFIKKLKSANNTALISNQGPDQYDHLSRKFDFSGMFDYQIIPMHAMAEKPDPKIFHTFLKMTGRNPSEVIFIDDSEENIVSAKKVGFKGIVFKSIPQLKEALNSQGIST